MSETEDLREAAQAVLDRWDSPQWEWTKHGPTADLMHALRAALAQQPAAPVTPAQLPERDMLRMVASATTRANQFSDDGPTQEPRP